MTEERPDTPSPECEMAKHQAEAAVAEFWRLVQNADVEYVGEDHEYVPDCPRLRRTHPNAEEGDDAE